MYFVQMSKTLIVWSNSIDNFDKCTFFYVIFNTIFNDQNESLSRTFEKRILLKAGPDQPTQLSFRFPSQVFFSASIKF